VHAPGARHSPHGSGPLSWNLEAKSSQVKFKTGAPYQEATLVLSESGNDVGVAAKLRPAGGAPISIHYTVPANGDAGKLIEGSYDAVSSKRLNDTERETSYSKGGKVVYTVRSEVSKDGKTLTTRGKGTNSTRQKVDGVTVYDKQ
jgi:hypothetical protein